MGSSEMMSYVLPNSPPPHFVSLFKGEDELGNENSGAQQHMTSSNNSPNSAPFLCPVCGKGFMQKNTFQNHLRSHREGEEPYSCDVCGKSFAVPARLTRHYRTHTGEKPYQCEYCNKSFSVKENLSVHRRIHTKERPYKCEVCERAFEHSGKLHRHMRIHTGERPHRCSICQKTFIQSGQLVIHMRTHTGEKPYVCKVCSKGFTCSKQLKVHTRTHTGEKPYTCDICGKSFGYNHVLKLHQVAHYGEKVYKCTLCNSTFNSKKSLETHIKTHSNSPSDNSPHTPLTPPPSSHSSSHSNSNATQGSDKENRESSDSEICSELSSGQPETPPRSPISYNIGGPMPQGVTHNYTQPTSAHSGVQISSPPHHYHQPQTQNQGQNNSGYPMLPPTVQIHQPPQSRTTFLYVTSKLPNSPQLPPSPPSLSPHSEAQNYKNYEKSNFRHSATIRDKVLASIEMFGYGLPDEAPKETGSKTGPIGAKISHNAPNSPPMSRGEPVSYFPKNFKNLTTEPEPVVRIQPVKGSVFHPSKYRQEPSGAFNLSPQRRDVNLNRATMSGSVVVQKIYGNYAPASISPVENFSCPPGGKLALALTKGSKAVNSLPSSLTVTPVKNVPEDWRNINAGADWRRKNEESPSDWRRKHEESPSDWRRKNAESPSDWVRRNNEEGSDWMRKNHESTSDWLMKKNESSHWLPKREEECIDFSKKKEVHKVVIEEVVRVKSPGKRTNVEKVIYGPRKRSSLILEKYAQESSVSESILSQRLRQSITFAT